MNALTQSQPLPHSLTFTISSNRHMTDDARNALLDIQNYITGLGYRLTIEEISKNNYKYVIESSVEIAISWVMDVICFYNHDHWVISAEEVASARTNPEL